MTGLWVTHDGEQNLKEGLNIIPFNGDSINTFVCYTVETFKNRQKTGRKLSEYKDLKIHIEGGSLERLLQPHGRLTLQSR